MSVDSKHEHVRYSHILEDDEIDEDAFQDLVRAAVALNLEKS